LKNTCHLSITKKGAPQGVSTVIDNIEKTLCLGDGHTVYRNGSPTVTQNKNVQNRKSSFLDFSFFKNVDFIYFMYMFFSAFKVVNKNIKDIKQHNLIVCHDLFCLFWVGVLSSKNVIRHTALYNHSDGHPIDTIKDKHKSLSVKFCCFVLEIFIDSLKLFAVYSLSKSATARIKSRLKHHQIISFKEVFNFTVPNSSNAMCEKPKRIWMIGTVCERKGQLAFFKKLHVLDLDEKRTHEFYVVGYASESDIIELSKYSFVKYQGVLTNVVQQLQFGDVCLSVSSNEGLPMSLIEAASMGCVIVSSDVGGCYEVCINEVNGFLFDAQYEVEELLSQLNIIMSDASLNENYSLNSISLYNEKFSVKSAQKFWSSELSII
jgi:glycosyltransferase involved in cell wall biosynthesis